MSNYFELYDIPQSFAPDTNKIKTKYYELSRTYHPDRYTMSTPSEQIHALTMTAKNNDAYKTLNDADSTMAYILKLNSLLEDEEKYSLPPAFLMDMMDLNELISDYEADKANEPLRMQVTNTLKEYLAQWEDEVSPLTGKYDPANPDKELLLEVKDYYFRKKYLLRIQQRINTFASR